MYVEFADYLLCCSPAVHRVVCQKALYVHFGTMLVICSYQAAIAYINHHIIPKNILDISRSIKLFLHGLYPLRFSSAMPMSVQEANVALLAAKAQTMHLLKLPDDYQSKKRNPQIRFCDDVAQGWSGGLSYDNQK